MYKRWDAAENEWRRNSLGAVLLIGSPILLTASSGVGLSAAVKSAFTLKLELSIAGGISDVSSQLMSNGFDFKRVNLASTAAESLIGGNLIGSSTASALVGNTINLSWNTTFGGNFSGIYNNPLSGGNTSQILFGSIGNIVGGMLGPGVDGTFLQGGMKTDFGGFGDFLGNFFGDMGGNALNGIFN